MRRRELSWRRIRWSRTANRRLLAVAIAMTAAFGAWRAVDPPRQRTIVQPAAGMPDLPAQSFAQRFTAAYLSYDSARPSQRLKALSPFVAAAGDDDPALGFTVPPAGARHVRATTIAQAYAQPDGGLTYVVAADTDRDGLLYLSVRVARRHGVLGIVGYPALAGAPFEGARIAPIRQRDVADAGLRAVVTRALGKYLAGQGSDLQADLATGADVALPTQRLTLGDVSAITWSPTGRAVAATVHATDPDGARMTLTYELDVQRAGARWFISAIQTLPTAH
jgi:hypothetical protein